MIFLEWGLAYNMEHLSLILLAMILLEWGAEHQPTAAIVTENLPYTLQNSSTMNFYCASNQ